MKFGSIRNYLVRNQDDVMLERVLRSSNAVREPQSLECEGKLPHHCSRAINKWLLWMKERATHKAARRRRSEWNPQKAIQGAFSTAIILSFQFPWKVLTFSGQQKKGSPKVGKRELRRHGVTLYLWLWEIMYQRVVYGFNEATHKIHWEGHRRSWQKHLHFVVHVVFSESV